MPLVYYNEIDPFCCAWLEELMTAGLIPAGWIDDRSIQDVRPEELQNYTQCHFFAGIGGWAAALRYAGWGGERPVWTGSCPCQPFSTAGQRKGVADERHLWPEFYRLIRLGQPSVVFGEQVASRDGRRWLSGVQLDLEALGYAVGAADLCAAGVGAPHIRQRLWWVGSRMADAEYAQRRSEFQEDGDAYGRNGSGGRGMLSGLEYANGTGDNGRLAPGGEQQVCEFGEGGGERMADSYQTGRQSSAPVPREPTTGNTPTGQSEQLGLSDFWSSYDLIPCLDGKSRRVEPGTFPLAHGVPARMGKLRAYGNAIVPPLAKVFIEAYLESDQWLRG